MSIYRKRGGGGTSQLSRFRCLVMFVQVMIAPNPLSTCLTSKISISVVLYSFAILGSLMVQLEDAISDTDKTISAMNVCIA